MTLWCQDNFIILKKSNLIIVDPEITMVNQVIQYLIVMVIKI